MDISDTPLLRSRIVELQNQVAPYSGGKIKSTSNIDFSFNNILSSKKLYIAIPIFTFFIFLLWRPSILTVEIPNDEGELIKKFSFKRFLVVWLVITLALALGLFGFNYKRKKHDD